MISYGGDYMSVDFILLGQNVKKYRKIADLTQEQLSNMTGYADSHIGQVKNAYGIPSYPVLNKEWRARSLHTRPLPWPNGFIIIKSR